MGSTGTGAMQKMIRINIGCGQTPTVGWRNYDNSASLRLSKTPFLPMVLHKLGFLNHAQYQFIKFACQNGIEYGDATKGLSIPDGSCEVLYSSHMVEHLDRNEASRFLEEAFRVLQPGGVIRIAVPDIRKQVEQYIESGDADAFVESTHLCAARPGNLALRLRLLLVGARHHQWMYDGNSLTRLLLKHGFVEAEMVPPGQTMIHDHHPLNLHERVSESVYVEARKPVV
jgi:predicted SAM-dependent methyltransferase